MNNKNKKSMYVGSNGKLNQLPTLLEALNTSPEMLKQMYGKNCVSLIGIPNTNYKALFRCEIDKIYQLDKYIGKIVKNKNQYSLIK